VDLPPEVYPSTSSITGHFTSGRGSVAAELREGAVTGHAVGQARPFVLSAAAHRL